MPTITEQLQTLRPSATDLKGLGFPDWYVDDYLTLLDNIQLIATSDDALIIIVDQNTNDISTNATDISTNATNITSVTDDLDTHELSSSQHGVTGSNVGDEDFCTTLVGGVVKLMALVNDASASTVSVTNPDATAAPVAYDQAAAQTAVTLVNELKGDVNDLVTDLTLDRIRFSG